MFDKHTYIQLFKQAENHQQQMRENHATNHKLFSTQGKRKCIFHCSTTHDCIDWIYLTCFCTIPNIFFYIFIDTHHENKVFLPSLGGRYSQISLFHLCKRHVNKDLRDIDPHLKKKRHGIVLLPSTVTSMFPNIHVILSVSPK